MKYLINFLNNHRSQGLVFHDSRYCWLSSSGLTGGSHRDTGDSRFRGNDIRTTTDTKLDFSRKLLAFLICALILPGIVYATEYTIHESRSTSHELRATSDERRATSRVSVRTLVTSKTPLVSAAAAGNRLLVVGEHEFRWYAVSDGGVQLLTTIEGAPADRYVRGDLFDLTGDGHLEALITSTRNGQVYSYIYHQQRRDQWTLLVDGLSWYFRVASQPGAGRQLFGQRSGSHQPFFGPVFPLSWHDGKIETGEPLRLPRGASLYAFRWLAGGRIITASSKGRARIWERRGKKKWKVTDRLPNKWRGMSAQWVATKPVVRGGAINVPYQLALMPWEYADQMVVVGQRPAIGESIGRVAYWTGWTLAGLSHRQALYASRQPLWTYEGEGAVMDVRPLRSGDRILSVVQVGRDSPFTGGPRQSFVLWFEIGPAASSPRRRGPSAAH